MTLQIHIAGAKRAGKTTLARALIEKLKAQQARPVLLDVDEVKISIYGTDIGMPDTPKSVDIHERTMRTIFEVIVPAVITAGGVPVVVAGHNHKQWFEKAVELSEHYDSILKFFILEPPTLAEAMIRAETLAPDDASDMKDFSDPAIQMSFLKSIDDVNKAHKHITDERLFWIPQGTPTAVLESASKAIWFV